MHSLSAITLIALICGVVVVEVVKSDNIFAVHEREHLSHKKLDRKLAGKLTSKHEKPGYAREVAHHVANLLAQAQEKYHPGAVLGKWSVVELLSLNHHDLDKCTMTQFKFRSDTCKQLSIHENLQEYCLQCLEFFKRNCMLNLELVYKRACEKSRVPKETFLDVLSEYTKDVATLNDDSQSTKQAIKWALPKIDRLVNACRVFNDVTKDLYNEQQETKLPSLAAGPMSFVHVKKVCQVVLSQSNN